MKLKSFEIQVSEEKQRRNYKCLEGLLFTGIIISNGLFITYISFLVMTDLKYPDEVDELRRNAQLIEMSVACWFADAGSAILLLSSALYTAYSMTYIYGGLFDRETRNILIIMTIFVVAFLTKTCWEWGMYHFHLEGDRDEVLLML
jgi:hypothetical protein